MSAWRSGRSPLSLYRGEFREAIGRSGKTLAAIQRALDDYGAGVLEATGEAVKDRSDLHLGDGNIIDCRSRPFDIPGRMSETLWTSWYSAVSPTNRWTASVTSPWHRRWTRRSGSGSGPPRLALSLTAGHLRGGDTTPKRLKEIV